MRALCLLREALQYRRKTFCAGLAAAGFKVVNSINDPNLNDVLVIWNRYGNYHNEALRFERFGATVIICENGYLRDGLDGSWFALCKNHHSGAGTWNVGGSERWDSFGITLQPWRTDGRELVLIGQRGIGEIGVAAPRGWAESLRASTGGRIRPHPGNEPAKIPLEKDLKRAYAVVTWSSAAALYSLIWGIPTICAFPGWIAADACLPLSTWLGANGGAKRARSPIPDVSDVLKRSDADRLAVFRRLAWAQWRIEEIESGEAFQYLLQNR